MLERILLLSLLLSIAILLQLSYSRLLCPQDSPDKNTRVGCNTFFQGVFLIQGWNQCLFCIGKWVLYHQHHLGSPWYTRLCYIYYIMLYYNYPIGEGNGNPLQYSCLENPMDGRAWQATAHGVAKSQAQPSDFTSLTSLTSYLITGEGNGSPLQCSHLENPMDRGAWWAMVHGVAESWTWLK